MKETMKIVGIVILLVMAVGFAIYALFGFMTYLLSDPFNWVKEKEKPVYVSKFQPDIDACRARGMYPVISGWDGSLKECKEF